MCGSVHNLKQPLKTTGPIAALIRWGAILFQSKCVYVCLCAIAIVQVTH